MASVKKEHLELEIIARPFSASTGLSLHSSRQAIAGEPDIVFFGRHWSPRNQLNKPYWPPKFEREAWQNCSGTRGRILLIC
jgi:hypothetical protein